jgi:hypothetical protein
MGSRYVTVEASTGTVVGDDAVVQHVGRAGADDAEDREADHRVGSPVDGIESALWRASGRTPAAAMSCAVDSTSGGRSRPMRKRLM